METLVQKLGGFGSAKYREFMEALEKVGAKLTTWYEAVEYKGEPKELALELCVKSGLFSKEHVAIGDDVQSVQTLASYLRHNPSFKNRKFTSRQCRKVVQNGDYAIIQKTGFKGGSREEVTNVITQYGGDREDIEVVLGHVDEKPLGYLVSASPQEAKAFAQMVHMGATTPLSREEMVKFAESMQSGAEGCVSTGDKSLEPFIGIGEKLADYWRNMPDDEAHIKLARQYYGEGLIDEAIGEYRSVLQMYPDNADYHYDLGILLTERARPDDAIVEYIEAIRLCPSHYFAHNNLAQVHESRGNLAHAENELLGAIRIDKSKPEAHGNLGRVYYHQGRLDEAIVEYEECLRLDPKHDASSAVSDLLQIARDDKEKVNQLERTKVQAWHEVSGITVVRFWGISIWRMQQLLKEFERLEIVYESIRDRIPQKAMDACFANVGSCDDLTLDQKAIADFSLLAVIEGGVPSPHGIECLKVAFRSDPEFLKVILSRSGSSS